MTKNLNTVEKRDGDVADELVAGRPWPVRDAFVPLSREVVIELVHQRRAFWLAAAAGYVELAAAGCDESLDDAREALAQADVYAP